MATISVSLPSDGSTADVADYNTPITTIVNEINGALDNSNISASAAIATSKIASDAGLPAGALAPSSVTPEKLLTGTGTTWAWQSWTPTMTNFTIGTGGSAGVTAKYVQIGKTVYYKVHGVLGTSGQSVGGQIKFTLPVTSVAALTAVDGGFMQKIGDGTIHDNGTNEFAAHVAIISTTEANIYAQTASSTYVQPSTATSSSVPMTWAANDSFYVQGFYEAA